MLRTCVCEQHIELLYNICVVRENHDLLLADLQTCDFAALCMSRPRSVSRSEERHQASP